MEELDSTTNIPLSISKFIAAAWRFCSWAEHKSDQKSYVEDMGIGHAIMAELYYLSVGLPQINEDEDTWDLRESIFEEDMEAEKPFSEICGRFATLDEEANRDFGFIGMAIADMADGLRQVYIGLQKGLEFHNSGKYQEALIVWRIGFEGLWGFFLAEALSTVHNLIFDHW